MASKPQIDLEALRRLRAGGKKPALPVIVTDYAVDADACRRNGFVALVQRPDEPMQSDGLSGLVVAIRTRKPFTLWSDLAMRLRESARLVILVDPTGRQAAQVLR